MGHVIVTTSFKIRSELLENTRKVYGKLGGNVCGVFAWINKKNIKPGKKEHPSTNGEEQRGRHWPNDRVL